MDLTPKQQTSEAVRQSETILITTGQHPSIDQVVSVLALAAILRKFGKKVSAIISDPLPQQVSFLDTSHLDRNLSGLRDFILKVNATKTEVDKLRYEVENNQLSIYITPFQGSFAPSDVTFDYGDFHYDLAIILGVPTRARIDRVYADNQGLFNSIPVVNLDFHRSNENYGAINLIEGTASSLCEILVALSESLQTGLIDGDIATIMLTGLMASTDRFTATHTTSKSLTVAAQMMAAGANQQAVVKGLFQGGAQSDRTERADRTERPKAGDRPETRNPDALAEAPVVVKSQPKPIERTEPRPQPSESKPEVHELDLDAPSHILPADLPEPTEKPIIDPSHIELSEFGEGDEDSADAPTEPAPPMADFAAAAEILAQRQADQAAKPSDQSER